MSDQINRNTMQVHKSVNTPDFSQDTFLNISGKILPACDKKYWKIVSEQVVEMLIEEKSVIDYAEPTSEPTAEELAVQIENKRKQNIKKEIELNYSITDEIGIIRVALAELLPDSVEVQVWNDVVNDAKLKYPKEVV